MWEAAQRIGQGFLYYRGYHDFEHVFSSKMAVEKEFVSGDFFNPEDVIPFDDEQEFLRDLYSVSGPLAKAMLKKRHPQPVRSARVLQVFPRSDGDHHRSRDCQRGDINADEA